ncbi:MAG: glycosyltransferase family 2 protein, partial [Candidatus Aureabacteria bacterium]|nr:glycosyltransferase family 2 protein [Candidatus Auribacterota bacterium]
RVLLFWHYAGNKFLTLLSNALTNLNLTDVETCYKAFRASVLKEVTFKSNRFGFEPEFTAKMAKKGYRIFETPISYSGRDYKEGKKVTWKDGLAALWHILRFNLFD